MRFCAVFGLNDPTHFVEMARTADAAGWDYVSLSDHVVVPERIESRYPYAPDGKPPFDGNTPWPDVWVSVAAMAAVTERLRFMTNVYILPLRHPLLTAKAVGTAALLSGGRVSLGVGAGWMREEFDILGADFATRGRRMNECIEVLRKVWAGGTVEHHGRFYDFPPLRMSPEPGHRIPIFVGGTSEPALRRAARLGDGWISVLHAFDELAELIAKLRAYREEAGRGGEPFEIAVSCSEVFDVDGYRRLEEVGATMLVTMPWFFYGGNPAVLADKQAALERFSDEVIAKMR